MELRVLRIGKTIKTKIKHIHTNNNKREKNHTPIFFSVLKLEINMFINFIRTQTHIHNLNNLYETENKFVKKKKITLKKGTKNNSNLKKKKT